MAPAKQLRTKHVVELVLLLAIAGLCLYFLINMLFNAAPEGTPPIQAKPHAELLLSPGASLSLSA